MLFNNMRAEEMRKGEPRKGKRNPHRLLIRRWGLIIKVYFSPIHLRTMMGKLGETSYRLKSSPKSNMLRI